MNEMIGACPKLIAPSIIGINEIHINNKKTYSPTENRFIVKALNSI